MDQADILPTEMVFTIKEPPRLGHVVKLTNSSDSTASPVPNYIHSFTQEDIDQGHILYVSASIQVYCHLIYSAVVNQMWQLVPFRNHTESKIRQKTNLDSDEVQGLFLLLATSLSLFQGNDAFTVDVSNGFTTVEDLHISVKIVPRLIPIQTFNFTVKEGLSRAINTEIVNISHPFYRSANIDFVVEEPPQHGEIRTQDGDELTYFTWEEVCSDMMKEIEIINSITSNKNITKDV